MSNAKMLGLVLGGGLALGAAVAVSHRPTATSGKTNPTSGTGGGVSAVLGKVGITIKPPVPVVTIGTAPATSAPVATVPAGPAWPAALSSLAPGKYTSSPQNTQELAAHILRRRPLTAPFNSERLALAAGLIRVSQTEVYPLDLLIGHAIAEGGGRTCMRPTSVSGAYGPLQVTRDACTAVGASYPPANVEEALRVGVRYMRLMRRTTSEAVNLTATLRIYGMGLGNYRKFLAAGCVNYKSRAVSVWRAECVTPTITTYTGKIALEALLAAGAGFHSIPLSGWYR